MKEDKKIKLFKTLGEKTNFLIIKNLIKKDLPACKINVLIKRSQSNTSMHLIKLKNLGLIKSKRKGKSIIYSIKDKDLIKIMKLVK